MNAIWSVVATSFRRVSRRAAAAAPHRRKSARLAPQGIGWLNLVVALAVLAAAAATGDAQQLPLAPTGDLFVNSSNTLFGFDVSNLNNITPTVSVPFYGHGDQGIAFDAQGNLYHGLNDGLGIMDTNFNEIGQVSIVDPVWNLPLFGLAIRPGQAFQCNPTRPPRWPFARLFVFDTTNPRNPIHTNTVDIPLSDAFGGLECRGLAFDSSGHLWVAGYGHLIKLTLDAAGNPLAAERFYQEAGNPFGLAFQPSTGLLFYSGVNSNFVAAVDTVNPSVVKGMITNVGDQLSHNPGWMAFNSSGDLFVTCSGFTSNIVVFRANTIASITGTVDASTLAPIRLTRQEFSFEEGFLAFKPVSGPLYHLCLLYDPFKIAKSGSTIPIKLQLCDGSGSNLSSSSIVLHAVNIKKVSDGTSGTVDDSGNANPDGDFRYAGGSYIFNLSTKGLAGGTYDLNFTVGSDPSVYKVQFQVKS